jgi:hypothetical protein
MDWLFFEWAIGFWLMNNIIHPCPQFSYQKTVSDIY